VSFLDALDPRYRLILCDIWGVVHDGVTLYPRAAERLQEWRHQNRCVCLISNAPRTEEAVKQQLARIGLPADAFDFVATSGEAGIAALKRLGNAVGFIGTSSDRAILVGKGVRIADDDEFTELACTGISEDRPHPENYRSALEGCAARGVRMHCLNPDRVVVRGGVLEACAGAIADLYESLGGSVVFYGKPYQAIYDLAMNRAENPGAARNGFDAVFVTGGIHGGDPFPEDFAANHGLGDWKPVAVVAGLA
jgi:HAD superfamily hydrolase (TIGR01459 family)